METSELRQFTLEELKSRVRQWQEELFRARIKSVTSEMKDTSIFKKLRKDIARGLLVIGEKKNGQSVAGAPQDSAQEVQDKGASTK